MSIIVSSAEQTRDPTFQQDVSQLRIKYQLTVLHHFISVQVQYEERIILVFNFESPQHDSPTDLPTITY